MPLVSIDQANGTLLDHFWQKSVAPNLLKPDNQERKCGRFEISFNPGRGARPGVPQLASFGQLPEPSAEANQCRFYEWDSQHPMSIANRPWIGLHSRLGSLAAFPNGAPYDNRGHYLLLPAEFSDENAVYYPHSAQSLSHQMVAQFLLVATAAGSQWVLGWNGLHAGASVNHKHAHLFRSDKLPCENSIRVNMGTHSYAFGWPAGNLVLEDANADNVWAVTGRLQEKGIPFNLMIRGTAAFVFAGTANGSWFQSFRPLWRFRSYVDERSSATTAFSVR